jgi:molybdopterin/thiamine biosynthesis adenylyltransferase
MNDALLERRNDPVSETPRNRVLGSARLLLIGGGNIGAAAAATIAELGFGFIRIIDRDTVELRNMVNQLYVSGDIGRPKAEALADHVRRINRSAEVEAIVADLEDVPLGLLTDVDLCLAGLDSNHARQVLNNGLAWPQGLPVIDGGVDGFGEPIGVVDVFVPGADNACRECAWGDEHYRQLGREMPCNPKTVAAGPPTGASALLGAAVASLMVQEAQRFFAGPRPMESRQLYFDLRRPGITVSRLCRAARCRFDHVVVEHRIALQMAFAAATVGDLLRAVDRPDAQLQFRRRIFDAGLFGGDRWLSSRQLAPYAARRLAELGLTRHDRIRAGADGLDALVDLDLPNA